MASRLPKEKAKSFSGRLGPWFFSDRLSSLVALLFLEPARHTLLLGTVSFLPVPLPTGSRLTSGVCLRPGIRLHPAGAPLPVPTLRLVLLY